MREAAGVAGGERERIEIALETHDAQRTHRALLALRMDFFKTVQRGHRVRGGAKTDVPDDEFAFSAFALQEPRGEERLFDVEFVGFVARVGSPSA